MDNPRKTYILNRGQYDQPTDEVQPAPSFHPAHEPEWSKDRLGLAEWLFDEGNPLTSPRCGKPLIGNSSLATALWRPRLILETRSLAHAPELLDFLAIKFREEGWDTEICSNTWCSPPPISSRLKYRRNSWNRIRKTDGW